MQYVWDKVVPVRAAHSRRSFVVFVQAASMRPEGTAPSLLPPAAADGGAGPWLLISGLELMGLSLQQQQDGGSRGLYVSLSLGGEGGGGGRAASKPLLRHGMVRLDGRTKQSVAIIG